MNHRLPIEFGRFVNIERAKNYVSYVSLQKLVMSTITSFYESDQEVTRLLL